MCYMHFISVAQSILHSWLNKHAIWHWAITKIVIFFQLARFFMSNDSSSQDNLILPSSLRKEMQIQCKYLYILCNLCVTPGPVRFGLHIMLITEHLKFCFLSSVYQQRWSHRIWNAMGDSISIQLHHTS